MALIDRLAHDDADLSRHIANHNFSAFAWFWSTGRKTRADIVAAFNLTVDDEVQLDELAAEYTSRSAAGKERFHSDLEAAGMLLENQLATKAEYRALFGLTE